MKHDHLSPSRRRHVSHQTTTPSEEADEAPTTVGDIVGGLLQAFRTSDALSAMASNPAAAARMGAMLPLLHQDSALSLTAWLYAALVSSGDSASLWRATGHTGDPPAELPERLTATEQIRLVTALGHLLLGDTVAGLNSPETDI